MHFSSGGRKWFVRGFVSVLEPIKSFSDYSRGFVSNEEIIYVPANGHLVTIDHFVGDTWIIWVDCESDRFEICNYFLVEQKCTLHHTMEGFFLLNSIKNWFALCIHRDALPIYVRRVAYHEFCKDAVQAHKNKIRIVSL